MQDYIRTILDAEDICFVDNEQCWFDYDDQYQGCPDYYEYKEEWC